MGNEDVALVVPGPAQFLWRYRPRVLFSFTIPLMITSDPPVLDDTRWYVVLKPPSRRARHKEAVRLGLKMRFEGRGRRRIERAPTWTKGAKYSAAEIEERATAARMMSRTVASIMRAQGLLPEEAPCQDK